MKRASWILIGEIAGVKCCVRVWVSVRPVGSSALRTSHGKDARHAWIQFRPPSPNLKRETTKKSRIAKGIMGKTRAWGASREDVRRVWFEVPTRRPDHRRSEGQARMCARVTRRGLGEGPCSSPSSATILSRSGSGAGSGRRSWGAGCMRLG